MLLLLLSLLPVSYGHSWIECTNYDPPSTKYDQLGNFDRSKCSGYPRNFQNQLNAGFGVDTSFTHAQDTCRDRFVETDYSSTVSMARYKQNTIIHLSHPAKNHVADTCSGKDNPSTSLKLMMSSQPGQDLFDISLTLVGGDHVNHQIDHLGYQRCFNFCENMDKSHCITSWQLPKISSSGRYSFLWIWQYNPNQYFSTCFDAVVDTTGSNNSTNAPTPSSTITYTDYPATYVPNATISTTPNSTITYTDYPATYVPNATISTTPNSTITYTEYPATYVPNATISTTPNTVSPIIAPLPSESIITPLPITSDGNQITPTLIELVKKLIDSMNVSISLTITGN